jgi:hypothetical protein
MEIWKPIREFEDIYSVSNFGRVMRTGKGSATKGGAAIVGKILTNARDIQGYERIKLCRDYVMYPKKIHRLVADAFLGPIPEKFTVNHIDGVKHNNSVENLEIVTRGENLSHAFRVIKTKSSKGERNPKSKLTEKDVLQIRSELASGCPPKVLEQEFGVSKHTISNIKVRKTWTHI